MLALPAALLGVVLSAAVTVAVPASAAPYGPADTRSCVSHVSAVADGTVFGAGDCGKGVAVSRRPAGSGWTITGAYWPAGYAVEAVAADGVATFVALSRPLGSGKEFAVGKLVHGSARLSALTVLGSTESGDDRADVVASGGRWAVGWTSTALERDRPAAPSSQVVVRGSLIGGLTRVVAAGGSLPAEPALALTPDDVHVLFTEAADGMRVLRHARVTVGGGHVASATRFAPAAGAAAAVPDAVVAGGSLVVAWSRAGAPAVALGTRRLDLPHRGRVVDVAVAASGGTAFVVTAERFSYAGGTTQRVYARDVTAQGQRRSTELSAAAGRASPTVVVALHDATAARGLATVSTSAGISSQR